MIYKLRTILFIFFLIVGFISLSAQTTYYIKNGGDNTNSGLSDLEAWADISRLDTTTIFNVGDTVKLKRGDTWTDMIDISDTYSPDSITITAYGTGSKPLINGDGVGASQPTIKISNLTGARVSYLEVTGTNAAYCMWWNNCQDVYVDSCDIHDNDQTSTIGHGIITTGNPRVFITNNNMYNLGSEGFYGGVIGSQARRALFSGNHVWNINQSGGTGDCVQFNLNAFCIDIRNNIFDNRGNPISGKGPLVLTQDINYTLTVIEYNTMYGNDGDTYGCSVGRADSTIVRYNNLFSDYASGYAIGGNFDSAYGNVTDGFFSAFDLGVDDEIYHMYNNYLHPGNRLVQMQGTDVNVIYFKNNLCDTTERFDFGASTEIFRDYNMYKASSGTETNSIYQSSQSYWDNDLFEDSEYRIKQTSSAYNAGTDVGLDFDRFGNTIPYITQDIGVHEWTPIGVSAGIIKIYYNVSNNKYYWIEPKSGKPRYINRP
jgi:hypothetical protein